MVLKRTACRLDTAAAGFWVTAEEAKAGLVAADVLAVSVGGWRRCGWCWLVKMAVVAHHRLKIQRSLKVLICSVGFICLQERQLMEGGSASSVSI